MNRYEIATKFKTCKEAFKSIGLEYIEGLYVCYNEEPEKHEQLCPFAENDTCRSMELPDHAENNFDRLDTLPLY